jgi:hypothetical protein
MPDSLTFCGRTFHSHELELMSQIAAQFSTLGVTEIARTVCELLEVFKKFAINERFGFQFRAEAFDFPNHANWSAPSFNPTSATFGKVTAKSGLVRTVQLSLRFYF